MTQTAITVTARGEVWASGQILASFKILTGSSWAVDRNNISRRSCTVTLTEGLLIDPPGPVVPSSVDDLFTPMGNEIVLYYGLVFDDGTIDWVVVGTFPIDGVDVDDSGGDLAITLTAADRSAEIIRSGFISTYTVPPSTNIADAIMGMLGQAVVGFPLAFDFTPTPFVTPATPLVFQPSTDPWTEATVLVNDNGLELFFSPIGRCLLIPVPDPATAPLAWTYAEGNGLMDELVRHLSRSATPNYVIRDGSGSAGSAPLRGIAIDNDPLSPTYIGGKYGRVRDYNVSSSRATQAQCDAAALADLRLGRGKLEAIEVKGIPKPDHDCDNVVAVTRVRAGLSGARYVMDSLTCGFGNAGVLDFVGRTV